MRKLLNGFFILLTVLLSLPGCLNNDEWEEYEAKLIKEYLEDLGDTIAVLKPSGLYFIEIAEGSGVSPITFDTVFFKYKGRFTDNTIFDTNKPDSVPLTYILGSKQVITGVEEGLQYMKAGGKAKLIIPSKLAFGFNGINKIVPGYTPVLWDLELDSIKQGR